MAKAKAKEKEKDALDIETEQDFERFTEDVVGPGKPEKIKGLVGESGTVKDIVKYRTETRNLKHQLTDDEKLKESTDLAAAINRVAGLESELKAFKSHIKGKIEQGENEIKQHSDAISNGYIYQPTDVEVWFNYKEGEVSEIRTDTGEVIDSRAMNANERQMTI